VAAVRAGGRLAFLDVLRGIAALGVVFYHLGNQEGVLNERFYWASHTVLNLGGFGVMLFFLVSGFIIPASLERHGSITEFWISRVFRLGPLFWFLSLVVFGFASLGWIKISEQVYSNWPVALFGNVTVLARHLGGSFLIGPAWTLPYEICFYGLTTILFATRLRRASAAVALAGGGIVLVATDQLIGPSAVTPWVSGVPGYQGNPLRVLGIALLVGAAAALLARSRASGLYAAVAALCFIPVLLNRPDPLYQAAIYLTLMFTGTVAHRIWAGQLRPPVGWVVFAACGLACAGGFWLHTTTWYGPFGQVGESGFTRSMMVASAFLLFTTFYLLRERVSWPAPLRWLGRVSYSLYLVHWVVMMSVPALPASVPGFRTLTVLMWLAITLAVSELTFRFVEDPAVKLGRTVTRRLPAVRARRARVAGPAEAPALALAARD
jgi:peptidoglycan/LPS O-acetylase OafA/YrhL